MKCELSRIVLEDLGAVRIVGADAVRFLQGQLSNDMLRLGEERSVLAGYHNAQGRTFALMRLVHLGEAELLAVLPRELATPLCQRLAKYVLRAKVTLTDVSADWRISGLAARADLELGEPEATPPDLPAARTGAQRRNAERLYVTVSERPVRWLEIAAHRGEDAGVNGAAREQWRALDIRAALPQVYLATAEQFVAQMLNLDALDAIAFDKGCYSGQDVIARAHYRGRVKRRAQPFRSLAPAELAPGQSGVLGDGRPFTVVDAARLPDGRCEFLAVAPLSPAEETNGATPRLAAEPLERPYPLSD